MPRQLPGDARNVHRRMDNTEFYLTEILPGMIPAPPITVMQDTNVYREWKDLNVELIHARNIRNVQLVPPHDTPDNFSLAWDFWWRVATRHEQARNAHVFTYNGVRRADGENAEGILELVQSIPNRIHALEQRAIARNTENASRLSPPVSVTDPYGSRSSSYPSQGQRYSTLYNGPRSAVTGVGAAGSRPTAHAYQLSTPSNLNSQARQLAQLYATYVPHPLPNQYPATAYCRSTDDLSSQPHRPPFTSPRHPVFWYWKRDLSGNFVLPTLQDGRALFVRSRDNMTDQGWGPGVVVHPEIRGDLALIDGIHTTGLIGLDRGPHA